MFGTSKFSLPTSFQGIFHALQRQFPANAAASPSHQVICKARNAFLTSFVAPVACLRDLPNLRDDKIGEGVAHPSDAPEASPFIQLSTLFS